MDLVFHYSFISWWYFKLFKKMIKKIKFVIIILFFSFIFFVFFKGLDQPNSYLPKKNITEIDTSLVFKNLYDQKEIVLGELISKNSFQ